MGQISSVQISTVQALNTYGAAKTELSGKYLQALKKGVPKPLKYVNNVSINFGQPDGFTVNQFLTDTETKWDFIQEEFKDKIRTIAARIYRDDRINDETDCLICEKRGNCYHDECWSSI